MGRSAIAKIGAMLPLRSRPKQATELLTCLRIDVPDVDVPDMAVTNQLVSAGISSRSAKQVVKLS
jgi:hypothetical protein